MNRAKQHVCYKDDWATPEYVINAINQHFNLVLDVAASPDNRKAERFYTQEDNGLIQPWTVGEDEYWWCNPPFSLKEQFLEKAVKEYRKGNQGIMLVPSSQETRWFRKYVVYPGQRYMVWPHRIQFIDPTPANRTRNTGASVIVAFINSAQSLPELEGEPWRRTIVLQQLAKEQR